MYGTNFRHGGFLAALRASLGQPDGSRFTLVRLSLMTRLARPRWGWLASSVVPQAPDSDCRRFPLLALAAAVFFGWARDKTTG